MKVSLLDDSRREEWSGYVNTRPEATFYHRVEWKGVMERNFGHPTYYLMAEDGGLRGILPLVFVNSRLFGSILCSMPFMNFGGVVADNPETEAALLEEASSLVHSLNADYLELRHLERSNAALPVKTHKVSMTVTLDPDPDVIWDSYKSKHRRNIRKAMKSGLSYSTGGAELLDRFYEVLSRGWRELGTPIYARSFFRDILETFGEDVQISVADLGGTPVATAFDGFHAGTVEGMWAYARREYSRIEPNYFLYWKLIERACLRGCRIYHLGRSTAGSTAEFYKRKWNAVSKQLYWEYVLGNGAEMPTLEVSNPKYRLAMAVWRKMPLRATCWLGPYFARSIP